jgi:hypothetical protein
VESFIEVRAHVDEVIDKLLAEESARSAQSAHPMAPRLAAARCAASRLDISDTIADAIATLDLAFEIWLEDAGSVPPGAAPA